MHREYIFSFLLLMIINLMPFRYLLFFFYDRCLEALKVFLILVFFGSFIHLLSWALGRTSHLEVCDLQFWKLCFSCFFSLLPSLHLLSPLPLPRPRPPACLLSFCFLAFLLTSLSFFFSSFPFSFLPSLPFPLFLVSLCSDNQLPLVHLLCFLKDCCKLFIHCLYTCYLFFSCNFTPFKISN